MNETQTPLFSAFFRFFPAFRPFFMEHERKRP